MPMGNYSDFQDCVSKNADKSDPDAYCGAIRHKVEDEGMAYEDAVKHPDVQKFAGAKEPQDDTPKSEKAPTDADLALINEIALEPLTASDVYIFSAKIIDDKPTANGRIWTREWMSQHVDDFRGLPVLVNHENNQQVVIGRWFHSEMRGNAIYGKAFVPLNTEQGREDATNIQNGRYRNVSISARTLNTKQENGFERILPSTEDRVLEVSFVAVGGCETCRVVNEDCGCLKQTLIEAANEALDGCNARNEALLQFANEALETLRSEYIRLSGFAFGSSISKATYKAVSEAVEPQTLKQMIADLKRLLTERDKERKSETKTDLNVDALQDKFATFKERFIY